MNEGHRAILNFIQALEHCKGDTGKVILRACHWRSENAGARSAFSSRSVIPAGREKNVSCPPPGLASETGPGTSASPRAESKYDGQLRIGEQVAFAVGSPFSGYIHLFNLGSSGNCVKLIPHHTFPANQVVPGEEFHLPSEEVFKSNPKGWFQINGPSTKEQDMPDILLAVVTRKDYKLGLDDLHPRLQQRAEGVVRGAGFGGKVEATLPTLFDPEKMPPASWEYGILRMEVV